MQPYGASSSRLRTPAHRRRLGRQGVRWIGSTVEVGGGWEAPTVQNTQVHVLVMEDTVFVHARYNLIESILSARFVWKESQQRHGCRGVGHPRGPRHDPCPGASQRPWRALRRKCTLLRHQRGHRDSKGPAQAPDQGQAFRGRGRRSGAGLPGGQGLPACLPGGGQVVHPLPHRHRQRHLSRCQAPDNQRRRRPDRAGGPGV